MADEAAAGGFSIFGVLDGHGGCEVARLAAHSRLPEAVRRAADGASTSELESRVAAAFVETDAWLREQPEVTRDQSGSTCVVAGVRRREDGGLEAFIANAGDSRGLVVRRRANEPPAVVAASEDHKPDRDDEHARIAAAGGFVSDADAAKRAAGGVATVVARLDGNLAVSRGLGDFAYKRDSRRAPREQKVSCVPELYAVGADGDLLAGDLLVLACDGIFDVMTNDVLARSIAAGLDRGDDLGDVAAGIVSTCLRELNSKDNMTLMIVEAGLDGSDYADFQTRRAGEDDDPPGDDRATDEIVGIDQYERQCDEAVKRSYITFLEYCETDERRKLPKDARDLLRRAAAAADDARRSSASQNDAVPHALRQRRYDHIPDQSLGRPP
eukprot:CAMPEP_0197405424 /NCGR_PEP_ID=MMETSP1165-20131217/24372_1 /TAXON_ID=284809 /ORGANISM="Chrysocystis fragilis, Strain CCMP3189" /LENGTH=383 /DNA_ID=CAMNT_0042931741 /DNA_START=33 /DNA_END=1184 /DNA_ORIENTATION=-